MVFEIFRQGVLNLMGQAENPCRLIGEAYQEDKMLLVHQKRKDLIALYFLYVQRIVLSCLFQQYSQTLEDVVTIEPYKTAIAGLGAEPIIYLYGSLAQLAVYPNSSKKEQQWLLDQVQIYQDNLQRWAHHAPMNHLHKFYLLMLRTALPKDTRPLYGSAKFILRWVTL
ncbi:hypothetical protein [Candidatus Parabeggiatoa sp. HSG14]|uniref:hypothetical protein n=1 Tax=Candidatus Parabeggiatoa sp. HSG14 TaxID=3055593 RepID=UPI0025A7AA82|nr:hypothetical protein [Thiotrichales bacterium HSG14]